MNRSVKFLLALVLILSASSVVAQEYKYDFKFFLGYTVSPEVNVQPLTVPGNTLIQRMSPRSSFSYGLQFDYFLKPRLSLGLLFTPQLSQLSATTTVVPTPQGSVLPGVPGTVIFADMVTYNVQPVVTYHFGSEKARFQPFVLGGAGVTIYQPSELLVFSSSYTGARNVDGMTKFAPTMGGGVKTFISPRFGFQFMGRYTPTRLGDGDGIWCGPYWGCLQLTGSQWSHQVEFTGGIILRF